MENALVWMLGISASVLALAYIIIIAVLIAAKRRMSLPVVGRKRRSANAMAGMPGMHYRTP
jgi:uncharacterized protein YoxC